MVHSKIFSNNFSGKYFNLLTKIHFQVMEFALINHSRTFSIIFSSMIFWPSSGCSKFSSLARWYRISGKRSSISAGIVVWSHYFHFWGFLYQKVPFCSPSRSSFIVKILFLSMIFRNEHDVYVEHIIRIVYQWPQLYAGYFRSLS